MNIKNHWNKYQSILLYEGCYIATGRHNFKICYQPKVLLHACRYRNLLLSSHEYTYHLWQCTLTTEKQTTSFWRTPKLTRTNQDLAETSFWFLFVYISLVNRQWWKNQTTRFCQLDSRWPHEDKCFEILASFYDILLYIYISIFLCNHWMQEQ